MLASLSQVADPDALLGTWKAIIRSRLIRARLFIAFLVAAIPFSLIDAANANEGAAGAEAGYRTVQLKTDIGGKPGFTRMDPALTSVTFTNFLTGDLSLTNAVAHNGSGVALGDVNGDGWVDLYFCNLQGPNRLFHNRGGWRFEEATAGGAACAKQLSTAATFSDIDGDGDLDLLVNGIAAGTRLFLNDGRGFWSEVENSGLSRSASATSMALADFDADGDLDLYCAHYIDVMHLADPTTAFAFARRDGKWEVSKVNGQSTRKPHLKDRFQLLPDGSVRELPEADGLYRNEGGGRFTPIQSMPGMFSDSEGNPMPPPRDWGLAVMFRDLNGDGFPDIYVCNDNASPDRVWIHSGKETFRALDPGKLRHTSRSSMGLDIADVNRDGRDDIFVVDMLARGHGKRMTQLVRDLPNEDVIQKIDGQPRYNRNMLFFGRADGSYVEAALMAGLAATDWSWCPVFLDVDLDGYEDLLVTTGFSFDVMDQDSHDRLRGMQLSHDERKRSRRYHPAWRTANLAFRNQRDGFFKEAGPEWGFDFSGISYGMALGDLDNDGDLDVVMNNLNHAAGLYRNDAPAPRIKVALNGKAPNTRGIGARVQLIEGEFVQSQAMIRGGRYLSSDQAVRVFAVGEPGAAHRQLRITWPDGNVSVIDDVLPNRAYEVDQTKSAPPAAALSRASSPLFKDASDLLNHIHIHRERRLDTGDPPSPRPRHFNKSGPGLSWFDINGDGWEDLLVTAESGEEKVAFVNQEGRSFKKLNTPALTGAQGPAIGWSDGLGGRHWLASIPNGDPSRSEASAVLAFNLSQLNESVIQSEAKGMAGPMSIADVDGDGDLDAFIAMRPRPGRRPEPSPSFIWINDQGALRPDATISEAFASLGEVNGAAFFDLDGEDGPDLALALEWGPVRVYRNTGGGFEDVTAEWGMEETKGWWTGITAGDFNGDGRLDLAAGNWGLNGDYALYPGSRFRLWYGDGGGDADFEIIESWLDAEGWRPTADLTTLAMGLPELAGRFVTHEQYGEATMETILGDQLQKFKSLEADRFESTVFLNRGDRFDPVPLPIEAQFAPAFSISVLDFDADGREDLFLSQNEFGRTTDLTRGDGGGGCLLRGKGDGTFENVDSTVSGIAMLGEQRGSAVADFNQDGRVDLAVAQINAPVKLYVNQSARRGLRAVLTGPKANPDAIGARLRVVYADGTMGPCRLVQAGSGYWSQNGAAQTLGMAGVASGLWIQWPGGDEQVVSISKNHWDIQAQYE